MQIKVLNRTHNELKFEIEGETHTLCNLLEKVLLEDETVDMAAYNVPHPLTPNAVIYIRTKGRRRPETALREAAKKILAIEKELETAFSKGLGNWKKGKKANPP